MQVTLPEARVGRLAFTEEIESYLQRTYSIFNGGLDGADTVVLLEMFYAYKLGSDGNSPESGKQAVVAVVSFLEHCKTLPWYWQPQHLQHYIASIKTQGLASATIRGRHHYIKDFCLSILADRPVANKILSRHPGGNFQQIADDKSRALVRGAKQRKKKLTCPTPNEVQQVFEWFEAEIVEAIETNSKSLYPLLRDRAVITMFYSYGLRKDELRRVDLTDFDFDPECPQYQNYGLLHIIGKGKKQRTLPILVPGMYEFVKHYIEVIRPHWLSNGGIALEDRNAMFFSDFRKRISKTAIERAVKLRFCQAGVTRNVSPHRLRDVFLTAMTDTLGLSSASDLAGHSMATTTEGYYRKASSIKGDPIKQHVHRLYKNRTD
ncbi:MAG: tyrosine-type recombinase/integrase [Methylotenera sp.]|nr:tyrosine-type recombinase/integrase [Methylotenera sp.]MDD4925917.1 tyrosine-type recombinase/integrase [Methylotenera sp.]